VHHAGVLMALALLSYSPKDAAFDVSAAGPTAARRAIGSGRPGPMARICFFQFSGLPRFLLPAAHPGARVEVVAGARRLIRKWRRSRGYGLASLFIAAADFLSPVHSGRPRGHTRPGACGWRLAYSGLLAS